MTFGVGFVHPLYAGVVTDRRLSAGGAPISDQYDKAGLVEFRNARFAYTLAGLAKWKDFDAALWTAMSLAESGTGEVGFTEALWRFSVMCTSKIASLGIEDPRVRKFSVLFAGYEHADGLAVTRFAMVSNFRKLSKFSGVDRWPEPFDDFHVTYQQTSPTKVLAGSIGGGKFLEDGRLVQKLSQRFLNPKTTALDVVNVAVRLIRENANAGIGEDCSSIVVPCAFSEEPAVYYHPNHVSSELRFPSFVQASHGAKSIIHRSPSESIEFESRYDADNVG